MRIRNLVLVVAAVSATLPAVTWAAFKPIRVLAPELVGLHCVKSGVCVDDLGRLAEAEALRTDAAAFVSLKVGSLKSLPKTVFCSTQRCAKAYGFAGQAAYNVGDAGVVIGPRGWRPYFVRHEFIHRLQCERLGVLSAWLLKPDWFMEGMAYSLSEDPRDPLPKQLQEWRSKFEAWHKTLGAKEIWAAAKEL